MIQAELAKLRSNCMSRQIGAVIAKNHRQLATGYNGTPPGITNCYEGGCKRCSARMAGEITSGAALDRCLCTHAEANAILHCAIMGIDAVSGATLYSTATPCLECTKLAITIGVVRFVCITEYPENARSLADSAGIKVELMDPRRIAKWVGKLGAEYMV